MKKEGFVPRNKKKTELNVTGGEEDKVNVNGSVCTDLIDPFACDAPVRDVRAPRAFSTHSKSIRRPYRYSLRLIGDAMMTSCDMNAGFYYLHRHALECPGFAGGLSAVEPWRTLRSPCLAFYCYYLFDIHDLAWRSPRHPRKLNWFSSIVSD